MFRHIIDLSMGFLVYLLVCALGLSMFANLYLLHQHSLHSHTESGEDGEGFQKVKKIVEPEVSPSAPSTNSEVSDKIEGVAVAFLLHAPKWFQRRYTMMVQNVYNNIPDNWKVQLFYVPSGGSQIGMDLNRGLMRMAEEGKIVLTQIPKEIFQKKKKRIELMTDLWSWDNMLADKIFIFGGNGVICSNSPLVFTNLSASYDYLGAPWSDLKGRGGNGGMSFRDRGMMRAAIEYAQKEAGNDSKAYKKWGQEDHFFVKTLLEMEKKGQLPPGRALRLAEKGDTQFYGATGEMAHQTALVVSGTLPGLEDKEREDFLQICPEIKMFYPSLHNPNCFGAQVHKEECAASICALTKKKGGC